MKPMPFPPTTRLTFDAADLWARHPVRFRQPNKQAVLDVAAPADFVPAGQLVYTRWAPMNWPLTLGPADRATVESRQDVYDYQPTDTPAPALEWHVNFADPHLFVAWASNLLAQDEMQVCEHPILASLRQALDATGDVPLTLTVEKGRPTPILVRGAQRLVSIATDPNPAEGRPVGLYGNRFASAPPDAVRRAIRRVDPPTVTNLIAIAAPSHGRGAYTRPDIEYVLTTAYTGFAGAVIETEDALGPAARTVVHTGFWGCGAFGGNRVLMPALQILAAHLAGVDRLVFHTFDAAGSAKLADAVRLVDHDLLPPSKPADVTGLITGLVGMNFPWGVSDGN
jgi:hypothetical protein